MPAHERQTAHELPSGSTREDVVWPEAWLTVGEDQSGRKVSAAGYLLEARRASGERSSRSSRSVMLSPALLTTQITKARKALSSSRLAEA